VCELCSSATATARRKCVDADTMSRSSREASPSAPSAAETTPQSPDAASPEDAADASAIARRGCVCEQQGVRRAATGPALGDG
jgi:hypothetical protein